MSDGTTGQAEPVLPPTLWQLHERCLELEAQHRESYERRLAYHTNVVLVLLGAGTAGLLRASSREQFLAISGVLGVAAFLAFFTPPMLKRVYWYFRDFMWARERLEVALGLRDDAGGGPPDVAKGLQAKWLERAQLQIQGPGQAAPLLWGRPRSLNGGGSWYSKWAMWLMRGVGLAAALLAIYAVTLALAHTTSANAVADLSGDQPHREEWAEIGTVGPFESGVACTTRSEVREQVLAIAAGLQRRPASRVRLVAVADTAPLSAWLRAEYGNNVGVAVARGHCVAGWLASLNALRNVTLEVEVAPPELPVPSGRDRSVRVSVAFLSPAT